MRSQIVRLCELKKRLTSGDNFQYEAGSVETLKRMVVLRNGVTIIPELAMKNLTPEEMKMIRHFRHPAPVREVSLVTHRSLVKRKILDALSEEILRSLPRKMRSMEGKEILKPVG